MHRSQHLASITSLFCFCSLSLVACGPTSSGNAPDGTDAGGTETPTPDGGGSDVEWDVSDAIEYRSLDTHPGCTTEGLEYDVASIPGYRCAAKAYPTDAVDPSKPIVLLIHGNSDKPGVWERFSTDSCEEDGATEGVDMLAENLLGMGLEVLAVDMRHDMVDDPADDNERYNAAKNMDHGWGVPIVQHFIHSVMEAWPDRRISMVGHSFGVTTIRDSLRRLHVNEGYPVWERLEDLVLLAGANHGVSSYSLCGGNRTMRGKVTCQMGNRDAFMPSDFMKALNGPGGAFETPCGDGVSAYGQEGACGGNAIDYTTIVMQDISDGTQQDLFVSEASSRLQGADNRLIGLNDFDESNYFFCGFLKNHFGPARALAGLAIAREKLID